jgi:hypothetical protein
MISHAVMNAIVKSEHSKRNDKVEGLRWGMLWSYQENVRMCQLDTSNLTMAEKARVFEYVLASCEMLGKFA